MKCYRKNVVDKGVHRPLEIISNGRNLRKHYVVTRHLIATSNQLIVKQKHNLLHHIMYL